MITDIFIQFLTHEHEIETNERKSCMSRVLWMNVPKLNVHHIIVTEIDFNSFAELNLCNVNLRVYVPNKQTHFTFYKYIIEYVLYMYHIYLHNVVLYLN